jgi:transposase
MKSKVTPPQSWLEGRRLRAWELKQQGWKQRDIATALGVTEGAVSQWLKRAREGGVEALRHQPSPGPQPRLSAEQRAKIPTVLAKGAEAYGFRGDLWTTKRVAIVIEREFGVRYHPAHVSRLLRDIGWSVQKPIKRASQRDEAAIETWRTQRWPTLKKGRKLKGARSSG